MLVNPLQNIYQSLCGIRRQTPKLNIKGASINSFASRFSEYFIDDENFRCTIGIMQKNLKKYMKYSENPLGTKLINNLTSSKYFLIATAIKKYLCLASYSLSLFLEKKELIEAPLTYKKQLWQKK